MFSAIELQPWSASPAKVTRHKTLSLAPTRYKGLVGLSACELVAEKYPVNHSLLLTQVQIYNSLIGVINQLNNAALA